MRILFVVEHFYPYIGGAEELFLGLAQSLVKKGNTVTVVTTLIDSNLQPEENYNGIQIVRIRCVNRYGFTFFSLPKIIQLAKSADIIHTTSYNAAIPSFFAGKLTGRKVIITFHEVLGKLWFSLPFKPSIALRAFYFFEWLVLKLPFYRYVAVSDYTIKSLISAGIPEYKVVRIYNGLNYSHYLSIAHTPPVNFVFCFFGRLGISKGIDILLEATRDFTLNHPSSRLKLIIPTYPKTVFNKVMRMIDQFGIREKIILLHDLEKNKLLEEISSSSCVVIPSVSEGFCFAAAESVALNVPVISSGKGALREVVSKHHIHMNNLTVNELVVGLERAIQNNYDHIPHRIFSIEASVNSYQALYKEVIQKQE